MVKKSYFPTFVEKDENKIENVGEQEFLQLVKNKSFHIVKDDAGGYKGGKYRFGSLGAMVTHIGILIILLVL